jgi:ubiquinol-cytochrome c reductase iron-sulfur subunit
MTTIHDDDNAPIEPSLNPRHFGIDPGEPWPDDVPKGQDDTVWRYQDDPAGARRAELRIAACWMVTLLASVGLVIDYVAGGQTQADGVLWGLAFLGLGVGFVLWARDLLPGHDVIASRGEHDVSLPGFRSSVAESFSRGLEPIARRPFLFKMLGAVGGVFGVAALFPLASMGPRPHYDLRHSKWGPGVRAVNQDGTPVKATDVPPNGILTVFPEGHIDDGLSPALLINLGPAFPQFDNHNGWNVGTQVAFSKVCTHAACPASLYNVQSHQLICPCHQSTFDVLKDCKPVFGPAPRSLPQLPIGTDNQGYIVSLGDYTRAPGPGWWYPG